MKKDGFHWDKEAEEVFCKLKKAMSEVPTLRLPFILETDANASGFGVVLVQEGRPLTFLSQTPAPKQSGIEHIRKGAIGSVDGCG